jgi:hypothetical protein
MMKAVCLLVILGTLPAVGRSESVIAMLEKKADAGDAVAQNDLGSRYQEGEGVPKDFTKAHALYQKAAGAGLAIAQSNLGFMYDMGLGVLRDRKVANDWYRKSAEQGYAPAMLNLGMNIAGGEGVPPDVVEGMKWVDLARFFTQKERDMKVKYRIRGAYDALKARMTKEQLEEAQKRSQAWYEDFRAKQSRQMESDR